MAKRKASRLDRIEATLREAALDYPGAYEESPWGERVVKVDRKVFLFMGVRQGRLALSVKLPHSGGAALELPFTTPTGYGLGKSGWVSASFDSPSGVPMGMMLEWIEESYRVIAPRRRVGELEGRSRGTGARGGSGPMVSRTPARASGRILLVGRDPLRLERGRAALERAGFDVAGTVDLDGAVMGRIVESRPRAVVIDLGRQAATGIELARMITGSSAGGVRVVLAGTRDAALERKARAAGGPIAGASRRPPGDPEFAAELASILRSPGPPRCG